MMYIIAGDCFFFLNSPFVNASTLKTAKAEFLFSLSPTSPVEKNEHLHVKDKIRTNALFHALVKQSHDIHDSQFRHCNVP